LTRFTFLLFLRKKSFTLWVSRCRSRTKKATFWGKSCRRWSTSVGPSRRRFATPTTWGQARPFPRERPSSGRSWRVTSTRQVEAFYSACNIFVVYIKNMSINETKCNRLHFRLMALRHGGRFKTVPTNTEPTSFANSIRYYWQMCE